MFSPFEQFEINVLLPLNFYYDFSITNFVIYLLLTAIIIIMFFFLTGYQTTLVPNSFQLIAEALYRFLYDIIVGQVGKKGQIYFPSILTVFVLILTANLLGLTPFGFTITAHISFTLLMSLSFFLAWILIAFKNLGLKFFNIFVPSGIPMWLLPLLVLIEILSFLIRPLSLAIRLFANMLAGHILLYIISSGTIALSSILLISVLPIICIIAFFILEIGICFLQAYVFTILLCIYLKDAVLEH